MVADTVFRARSVKSRGNQLLWLQIGAGHGVSGAAEWTVLASLIVPIKGDERIFFGCRVNKRRVRRLVALGLWEDGPYFTEMHRAWKVNIASRSFDEIPAAGVDCVNSDHGE